MKSTDARFKVSAYLRMAQLTTDDDLRAEYVSKAQELIENMESTSGIIMSEDTDTIMSYLESFDVRELVGVPSENTYNDFKKWCLDNKKRKPPTKSAFSRVIHRTYGLKTVPRKIGNACVRVYVEE